MQLHKLMMKDLKYFLGRKQVCKNKKKLSTHTHLQPDNLTKHFESRCPQAFLSSASLTYNVIFVVELMTENRAHFLISLQTFCLSTDCLFESAVMKFPVQSEFRGSVGTLIGAKNFNMQHFWHRVS